MYSMTCIVPLGKSLYRQDKETGRDPM